MFFHPPSEKSVQSPPNSISTYTQPHFCINKCDFHMFRNYTKLSVSLHDGINVVYGDNGAGKSNFLEGISLFAPGKGLREENIKNFLFQEKEHFRLSTSVEGPLGLTRLVAFSEDTLSQNSYTPLSNSENSKQKIQRLFLRDGQPMRRIQNIVADIRQVWIGTYIERLIGGNNQQKRKFLDRMIAFFYPTYNTHITRYEKLLRMRLHCLYNPHNYHNTWLTSIERQIAENAVAIAATRCEFVDKFNRESKIFQHNGALGHILPRLKIMLDGFVENSLQECSASDTEDMFMAYLSQHRDAHKYSNRMDRGIHLSVIDFFNCDKNMLASLTSTGEKKILGIALAFIQLHLMRQLSYNYMPILLFDEVSAHLDKNHRFLVFEELKRLNVQAILTATQRETFEELNNDALFFHCHNARITPEY